MSTPPETRLTLTAYTFAARTSASPVAILDDVSVAAWDGLVVADRARGFVILRPKPIHRYLRQMAIASGLLILIAVLLSFAITPLFVVLLPLALIPAGPYALDRKPMLAVAAVEEGGSTVVTVDGRATDAMRTQLESMLGNLPPPNGSQIHAGVSDAASGPAL